MDRTPFQAFCSQGQNEQNARWALQIQTRLYRSTREKVRQGSLSAFQMYFGTGESSLWREMVDMLEQHCLHSPWFEECVSSPLNIKRPKHSANPFCSLFSSSSLFTRKIAAITAAMAASLSAAIFITQCLLVPGPRISTGIFFMQTIQIIPIIPHQAFLFQNWR